MNLHILLLPPLVVSHAVMGSRSHSSRLSATILPVMNRLYPVHNLHDARHLLSVVPSCLQTRQPSRFNMLVVRESLRKQNEGAGYLRLHIVSDMETFGARHFLSAMLSSEVQMKAFEMSFIVYPPLAALTTKTGQDLNIEIS